MLIVPCSDLASFPGSESWAGPGNEATSDLHCLNWILYMHHILILFSSTSKMIEMVEFSAVLSHEYQHSQALLVFCYHLAQSIKLQGSRTYIAALQHSTS